MTLTSLFPTLNDSIPAPFDRAAWPVRARPTLEDVVIAGVSLLRLTELCQTPCIYTGAAVIPLSDGVESPAESTTVIICSVLDAQAGRVRIDTALDSHQPCWTEARLIRRISHSCNAARVLEDAAGRPSRPPPCLPTSRPET